MLLSGVGRQARKIPAATQHRSALATDNVIVLTNPSTPGQRY